MSEAHKNSLCLGYWNINGVTNKLENDNVLAALMKYDFLWVAEIKSPINAHLPGYTAYRNSERYMNHGGICLYMKNSLVRFVSSVRFDGDDAIWLNFSFQPDITFGAFYIPPEDSSYYKPQLLAKLQSKLKTEVETCIIFGDFNAKIDCLSDLVVSKTSFRYPDQFQQRNNSHGAILKSICIDNDLLVANNLVTSTAKFDNGATYKYKGEWISQIDLSLISTELVNNIEQFNVNRESLPSDHAIIEVNLRIDTDMENIASRASQLEYYYVPQKRDDRKPIPYSSINQEEFIKQVSQMIPNIEEISTNMLDSTTAKIIDNFYSASCNSVIKKPPTWETVLPRWERLLEKNDPKYIWRAINWKGNLDQKKSDEPSPEEFKIHFEKLLNPRDITPVSDIDFSNCPNVPVLDDPISMDELNRCIKDLNPNKASDINGISPGIFKLLSTSWLQLILILFNVIFLYVKTPSCWIISKMIVMFKKGKGSLCDNYRGISINDILYRVFDKILYNRLELWYKPTREQAGAQKNRGSLEQILTIRLLIDYARKSKKKLYLLYIDFEKAYDKVPRRKLMEELKHIGCGQLFLKVLTAIYSCTKMIMKSAIIIASRGVRQGAATSVLLFIIYIDRMVKILKESMADDGFLGSLHILLLMDDAVLLATSRENIRKKLSVTQCYCNVYGMSMNMKKTKFMVINGTDDDKRDIHSNGVVVQHCEFYIYLGSPVTADGLYKSVISRHVNEKMKHFIKYCIFLDKNPDFPFSVKKRVAEACLLSTVLYGCETWLTNGYGQLNSLYMKVVKSLLKVRTTTCNDLCLIESDMPSLKTLIEKKRTAYLKKKIGMLNDGDPLQIALDLARSGRTYSAKLIDAALVSEHDIVKQGKEILKHSVSTSSSTKRCTYRLLNPNLDSHNIYKSKTIPEYLRITFTRFRLSSHRLRIETGRWVRTPPEQRLCDCGSVQNEEHVLLFCEKSKRIRERFNIQHANLNSFFCDSDIQEYNKALAIYQVLKTFENN